MYTLCLAYQQLKGKGRGRSTKSNFEQLKLQLETQTRVAESIEHERDRAYDDFVMAQVRSCEGVVCEVRMYVVCHERGV